MNSQTRDFLWEIGVEEIPARFLTPAVKQLRELVEEALLAGGLDYSSLNVYATPRRLALLVEGLPDKSRDSASEAKGPAVKASYDENGEPTRALLGFCKGQGIEPGAALKKEINGNMYVYALKQITGRETAALLPEILPPIMEKLFFPKPMRWGYNSCRFARPVRWMAALFGSDMVEIEFAGIKAGRSTRGHRLLGSDNIVIPEPAAYLPLLRENYVICDQDERRDLVWQQIQAEAERLGGRVEQDEELLTEVTYLLEYPAALSGRFEEEYLQLPEELVITPMREHQRYFPVYDAEGKLLPRFITVKNGDAQHLDIVAAGNEKVLRSRLKDAEFFYREDLKDDMARKAESLSQVVFHEKLGSMRQKVERIRKISVFIAQKLGLSAEETQLCDRAAFLAKADLTSRVVYEFPELQGIIGEYYALAAGEDAAVAQAIREHYLPRFADDNLPESRVGMIVALADKLDSVSGFFAVGLIPSGSQDPFALRRAAAGAVQIFIRHQIDFRLREALVYALELLGQDVPGLPLDRMKQQMENTVSFINQRLENFLSEKGIDYDIINAIKTISADEANPFVSLQRAFALHDFRRNEHFHPLIFGFNRVANILRSAMEKWREKMEHLAVNPALFTDASERELYAAALAAERAVAPLAEAGRYQEVLEEASKLTPYIDAFFEAVMVLDKDEAVRDNRLGLLKMITDITNKVADLSRIVE